MRSVTERLLQIALDRGALTYGDFTLASGQKSSYYFDGRQLTLDSEGAYLIGKAFFALLSTSDIQAVGGPTLGADPIVTSIALTSQIESRPISAFIVRKEVKGHGRRRDIEGPLEEGSRVAIVDDTCTTRESLLMAIKAAEKRGCAVVKVLAILDRKEGGSENLAQLGYDFHALLEASADGDVRVAV